MNPTQTPPKTPAPQIEIPATADIHQNSQRQITITLETPSRQSIFIDADARQQAAENAIRRPGNKQLQTSELTRTLSRAVETAYSTAGTYEDFAAMTLGIAYFIQHSPLYRPDISTLQTLIAAYLPLFDKQTGWKLRTCQCRICGTAPDLFEDPDPADEPAPSLLATLKDAGRDAADILREVHTLRTGGNQ